MKKDKETYDIFISYRRDNGWDSAKHLRDILVAKGYSVFFDLDSLRSGDFNTALLDVIKDCTDFIIILSPNALDRCVNEGDWVRQELACALQAGKNVIPVASAKFHFPEKLPEDINDVRWKNVVSVNIEYFDATVSRLISFLHSKPHKSILRWLIPVAAVCVIAVAVAFFFSHRASPAVPEPSPQEVVQEETVITPARETPSGNTTSEAASNETSTAEQPAATTAESGKTSVTTAPEKKEAVIAESEWHGPNILMSQIISINDSFDADALPAFGGEVTRGEIGSITFLDTMENKPENAWDVSQDGDGSVMAWTVPDGELYNLYIAANGGVYAPEDCSYLFCGFQNASSFTFGNAFHTEHTVNMSRMFFMCLDVRVLDLSSYNTENVTQMIMMFDGCISLRALDLSGFNTSNVTNMLSMFDDCRELQKLDLSSFDTAKVKYMPYMFHNCRTLKELDISMFDISHAEAVECMFQQCVHLKSLYLGKFDTAMYPSSSDLFTDCSELTDVYYGGTQADWESSGLGETLPAGTHVHFAYAETNQDHAESGELKHIWGDFVPEGTATIRTKDGNEYVAIANSLVREASGIELLRSGAYLYSGFDNRSEESEYTAKDMVYFKDIASVERTDDVFQVTDRSGNAKEIKLLSDAKLLFIGTEDNGIALEVKETDIISIHFDWSTVPETDVKYCKISQIDGTFVAPTAFFWFLVNKNEGTEHAPSMTLSRELTPYTDRTISVMDLQRIEITKNPTDSEFASSSEEFQTKMIVYLKNGEQKEITTSKFFVLFAKAKDGLMHTLDKSRLSEIIFY